MKTATPSIITKREVPETSVGIYSSNRRHCGYSDAGGELVPPSSGGSERARKIAINCTTSGHRKTRAINCTENPRAPICLSTPVRDLISYSITASTKRAYAADMAHFEASGRTIPSTPQIIAEYLAEIARSHAVATIQRRLAAISKAHRAIGADDPTKVEIVKATMRGIRRAVGTAQREAKPILREDLFTILERIGDRPKDLRDKALLLIGFAGAFRRSEVVGLDVADIEHVRQGIVITLRRSKTDQIGAGRKIGIPFGRTRWCPIRHLTDWLDHAEVEEGPIFRGINRHGHVAEQRLSGEAVSIVVKERANAAGFDPSAYSGHSLRAGLATSAAMAGASTWKIRQQTGHASDAMLSRYIRDGDMFTSNAVGAVL